MFDCYKVGLLDLVVCSLVWLGIEFGRFWLFDSNFRLDGVVFVDFGESGFSDLGVLVCLGGCGFALWWLGLM